MCAPSRVALIVQSQCVTCANCAIDRNPSMKVDRGPTVGVVSYWPMSSVRSLTRFERLEASRVSRGAPDLTLAASRTEQPAKRKAFVRTDWAVFRGTRVIRMKMTALDACAFARQLTKDTGKEHTAAVAGGRWRTWTRR